MMNRLAMLALTAVALSACSENATEPSTPMPLSMAVRVTPAAPKELPTRACSTISPREQIEKVLALIAASTHLSAVVKAQITESLGTALAALSNHDLASATSALESAATLVGNSAAPQPAKERIIAVLACVLSHLGA